MVDKFFEEALFFRPSAEMLLQVALGHEPELPTGTVVSSANDTIGVEIGFDGDELRAGVLRDLVVTLRVPEGFHLYGEPTPQGMVATSVDIDAQPGLIVREPVLPETHPMTLAGTGDTLQIYEGDVVVRVPITHLGRMLVDDGDGGRVLRVTGTVRWQSCDDTVCQIPRSETFSIDIPASAHNRPGADTATHLGAMMGRKGDDRQLGEMFGAITGADAPVGTGHDHVQD